MEFINNNNINNNFNINSNPTISTIECNLNNYYKLLNYLSNNINSFTSIKDNIININKLFENGFSKYLNRDKFTIKPVIKSIINNIEIMEQCHITIKSTKVLVGSIPSDGDQEVFELVGSISNDLVVSSYALEVLIRELNGSADLLRKVYQLLSVASIYNEEKNVFTLNKIMKLLNGSATSIINALNTNNIILNNLNGSSNQIKTLINLLYHIESQNFYNINDELESIIQDEIQDDDNERDLEIQFSNDFDGVSEFEYGDGNMDSSKPDDDASIINGGFGEHFEIDSFIQQQEEEFNNINDQVENEDQIQGEDQIQNERELQIQVPNYYADEPEFEEDDNIDSGDIESDNEQDEQLEQVQDEKKSRIKVLGGRSRRIIFKGFKTIRKILSYRFSD